MDDGGSGIWREVSLWDSGEEGPSSFGLERAVADHRQGLGEGSGCPPGQGQGLWDLHSMALEDTWNPVLQLPRPCPLSDTFYHFPHPSPYTFPDTVCPLLPKSSYSSILPGLRESCRCTASTLRWASIIVGKRFLYGYALPILLNNTFLNLVLHLQKNKGFESIER